MSASNPRIIPLEEGWEREIKAKVSQSIWFDCAFIPTINSSYGDCDFTLVWTWLGTVSLSHCSVVCRLFLLLSLLSLLLIQAIDRLEEMLDGKNMRNKSALFGPAEYVQTYT